MGFTLVFLFIIFRKFSLFIILVVDESNYSEKESYEKHGSESGSYGTFSTGLGGLLCGVWLPLGVTLYADELCNGDWG